MKPFVPNLDRDTWLLVFASYLGGAITSSIIWYYWSGSSGDTEKEEDGKNGAGRRRYFLERAMNNMDDLRGSFDDLKGLLHDFPQSFDEIKSRIGELPALRRRTPWPWDRIRRTISKSTASSEPSLNSDDASQDSTSLKADFCIGSIFGIDVGGTLAKLVYFEQRVDKSSSTTDPIGLSLHGERFYRRAHSSQENMSRLSSSDQDESSDTQTLQNATAPQHAGLDNPSSTPPLLSPEGLERQLRDQRNGSDSSHRRIPASVLKVPMPSGGFSAVRRTQSLIDLKRNRAQALDHFYNFARHLDSVEETIKDDRLKFYSRELNGEFHFIHFETRWMRQAVDLIRDNNLHFNIKQMGATGGGAHKYAAQWQSELGIEMKKEDELDSLVAGMQFVLRTCVGECYTFRPREAEDDGEADGNSSLESTETTTPDNERTENSADKPCVDESSKTAACDDEQPAGVHVDEWWWSRQVQRDAISYSTTYPYLLVTIGTGVSILRVDGPRQYERVSGSTIGGGTYWGLMRLLTDVEHFDGVIEMAAHGDPTKVDMMVGDIYGRNSDALEKLGLPAHLVASSFGKLVAKDDPAAGLKQEDLARALLMMITNNIGQVAYLNAKLAKTKRIYFVGNFLRQNILSQRRLSYAINYWSKGEMEALFLEHEGYFGALGAFLQSQNYDGPRGEIHRSHSLSLPIVDTYEKDIQHQRPSVVSHIP